MGHDIGVVWPGGFLLGLGVEKRSCGGCGGGLNPAPRDKAVVLSLLAGGIFGCGWLCGGLRPAWLLILIFALSGAGLSCSHAGRFLSVGVAGVRSGRGLIFHNRICLLEVVMRLLFALVMAMVVWRWLGWMGVFAERREW